MILLVHLLFGAAVGSTIKNVPLAVILAFLSHYFLDLFPHIEYNIENIGKKQCPAILKILLDFLLGVLFISVFSKNQYIIYICAISAILPDGLTVLGRIIPGKVLAVHNKIHTGKIHFLKYKKISNFWRVSSQVAAAVIALTLLKLY